MDAKQQTPGTSPAPDAAEPEKLAPAAPPALDADALLQEERQRQQALSAARKARRGSRYWILLLGMLLAAGTMAAYSWKRSVEPDAVRQLEFASLYLTAPLALSVICVFAYFRYRS